MNYHTSTNQKILRKFVDRDVIMLASDIVSYIQEYNLDFGLDVDNMSYLRCPECGGTVEESKELNEFGEQIYICNSCHTAYSETEIQELDTEYTEIYEYWFVTDWLADKLKEKGEVIINEFHNPIWGRQCTGQAILLDNVIGQIAEDMEILEGQKYEWEVK